MDYGRIMSSSRFETILADLQLSKSKDRKSASFIFHRCFEHSYSQSAVNPGGFLYLEESVIKSFHKNLS